MDWALQGVVKRALYFNWRFRGSKAIRVAHDGACDARQSMKCASGKTVSARSDLRVSVSRGRFGGMAGDVFVLIA